MAVTDLFPGPKYEGPQAGPFIRAIGQPSPDRFGDYCSGCPGVQHGLPGWCEESLR